MCGERQNGLQRLCGKHVSMAVTNPNGSLGCVCYVDVNGATCGLFDCRSSTDVQIMDEQGTFGIDVGG